MKVVFADWCVVPNNMLHHTTHVELHNRVLLRFVVEVNYYLVVCCIYFHLIFEDACCGFVCACRSAAFKECIVWSFQRYVITLLLFQRDGRFKEMRCVVVSKRCIVWPFLFAVLS